MFCFVFFGFFFLRIGCLEETLWRKTEQASKQTRETCCNNEAVSWGGACFWFLFCFSTVLIGLGTELKKTSVSVKICAVPSELSCQCSFCVCNISASTADLVLPADGRRDVVFCTAAEEEEDQVEEGQWNCWLFFCVWLFHVVWSHPVCLSLFSNSPKKGKRAPCSGFYERGFTLL